MDGKDGLGAESSLKPVFFFFFTPHKLGMIFTFLVCCLLEKEKEKELEKKKEKQQQRQHWWLQQKNLWPAKPKIFTIWSFTEKGCQCLD